MFNVPTSPQDEQGKRKCTNGYIAYLTKDFVLDVFSKERSQRSSKSQEMVSVRSLHAITNKNRRTDRSDRYQSVYKLTNVCNRCNHGIACVSHILMLATIADHDRALDFWPC